MRSRWHVIGMLLFTVFMAGCASGASNQEIPSIANNSLQGMPSSEDEPFNDDVLIIATGDMSGVYFPIGQALAGIYERKKGVAVGTRVTDASVENMALVGRKQADIGFSTADVLDAAEQDISRLRALTGFYPNYMQVVTTKESGIYSLADLKGKRISTGKEGSGTKIMAERVLRAAGLAKQDTYTYNMSFSQAADALRNGAIDAAFFSSGLPNPEITELAMEIPITLLPISGEVADRLVGEFNVYTNGRIPQDLYAGNTKPVESITVPNVLLAHQDITDSEAYQLVESLYSNLPELQDIHPAVKTIKLTDAMDDIPVEYHPGALLYFKKQGFIH
ncbi:MAG: TAXI family TRAP transporter solute-binding subunit [Bacillus sp. (in: firmicutes)]